MKYLILYFVFGAIVNAGIVLMNKKSGNWHGWGSIGFTLLVFPFWPLYTIQGIYGMLTFSPRKCGWCGNYAHDDDEMKAHILVCDLHPMRKEIERVNARADVVLLRFYFLWSVCRDLIDYRDHNTLNFQLEKADDFINRMREFDHADS
jgi:hypothetical protein